ncbi:hypothetical protein C0989_004398, partial [Termitomyces sp. Mn162]
LKFPPSPDSNKLKLMTNNAMKSSAPSASPLQSLHNVLMPSLLAWITITLQQFQKSEQTNSLTSTNITSRALSETTQGTLRINANLWNELYTLVNKIHTSPNL